MKILKRDGSEVDFDYTKIERAIEKANGSVMPKDRLPQETIQVIASNIESECKASGNIPTVESVQDKVVYAIMAHGAYVLANNYITYRYSHALQRQKNTTDDQILGHFPRHVIALRRNNGRIFIGVLLHGCLGLQLQYGHDLVIGRVFLPL